MIPEAHAAAGDVLVWRGVASQTTPHSAVLTDPVVAQGKSYLDEDATRLQTKNGLSPETNMTLKELNESYGESYNTYRKQ